MVICLIHPHTCGFAKTAAWQIARAVTTKVKRSENETPKSHHTRVVQEIYNRFTSMFSSTGSRFAVDFKSFNLKLPELRKTFSTWNSRKAQEREQYLEAFSTDTWDKLSPGAHIRGDVGGEGGHPPTSFSKSVDSRSRKMHIR